MITENILDDTCPQNNEFANCKIKYLLAQNQLMTVQLNSICNLVNKYKKVIDILSKPQTKSSSKQIQGCPPQQKQLDPSQKENAQKDQMNEQIGKILIQADKVIQNCMNECKQISNTKNIFPQQEGTITPAFFSQLVLSYQKTISQLKHSIHQREILLQELETTPNHPMKRVQDQTQSTAIIKAIQSYDIYPKISEKCRKQILQLKHKKRLMEMESSSKEGNQNLKSKRTNSSNLSEIDKTVKKVSQYCSNSSLKTQDKTQFQAEAMSPFQKTILIYKKKKIFNDILEAKVIDLKKKINQKQQCNQILRKRLENEVWQNIQNINHFGKNLDEDDPAYLSMLNQSIKANNLDFSVDISRVMAGFQSKGQNSVNVQNILEEVNRETEKQNRKQ